MLYFNFRSLVVIFMTILTLGIVIVNANPQPIDLGEAADLGKATGSLPLIGGGSKKKKSGKKAAEDDSE